MPGVAGSGAGAPGHRRASGGGGGEPLPAGRLPSCVDGAMRCLLQVLATMSVAGIDVGDSTSCIALARKGGAQNSGCACFASGLARISLRVSLVGAAYL